jgi:hypothetical protein
LGDWLAATLPNIFGASAGANNLTDKSNAQVASFFQTLFAVRGMKLEAQVMATALAVYVTNATLNDTGVGAKYGFRIGGDGVGVATVNVGTKGAAFGVANYTTLSVLDLLLATDAQSVNGVLYNRDAIKRNMANVIYTMVNEAGDI